MPSNICNFTPIRLSHKELNARLEFIQKYVCYALGSGGGGGGMAIGSPVTSGTDSSILFVDGGNLAQDNANFNWDDTDKRLTIANGSTTTLPELDDHDFKSIGNRWYLGDTSSNEPTFIEFGDPYGDANSTSMRMSLGWMGGEEFNIGINFDYRGQVHQKYDTTKFAQWVAANTHYFLMQAQGIGFDWNDNAGSKVAWRFDNIEVGNEVKGAILSTNGINVVDYTTSTYQNNDGTMAQLRVLNNTLSVTGVDTIQVEDATQLLIGSVNDGTTPLLGVQSASTNTYVTVRNDLNSTATNRFRMIKSRAGSFNLTTGDIVFDIQGNTLCSYQMIAGTGTFTVFKLLDHRWTTFFTDGNEYERMRIKWDGNVGIGASNPTAALHIKAGTAAAGSAPLKLTAGTNLTTPEDGAFEFDGTNLYFTVGGVRKTVTLA